MEILKGVLMGLIDVAILFTLFLSGILIFMKGVGSAFIGLPLAMRAGAKQCKKKYLINTLLATVFDIFVIVLMLTVLNQFLVWILLGYFVVPLIMFFIFIQQFRLGAKERIAKELEKDKL